MSQQIDNRGPRTIFKNTGNELLQKWATFAGVILSPLVFILIVATVALFYFSFTTPSLESQPVVTAIITVVISIFSGVVGALVSQRWSEITEGGILITRGKSAIRGLKLLLLNISAIEQRIKTFITSLDNTEPEHMITRNSYEELVERCNSLQEEAINAIEEWQDIIPEAANLKTQIGLLSDLKVRQVSLEQQVTIAWNELDEAKAQSEDEKEVLTGQLREKENELSQVKKELRNKEAEIGSSVLSGLPTGAIVNSGRINNPGYGLGRIDSPGYGLGRINNPGYSPGRIDGPDRIEPGS